MFHQIIVFSQFLQKEIALAPNIKNKTNRKIVCQTLKHILQYFQKLQNVINPTGLFIFAGQTVSNDIFEIIKPIIKLDIFIYRCEDRFDTTYIDKYMKSYCGSIIFANGDQTLIYIFDGSKFIKFKHITANLIKRQKKGGQSAVRFARLAEESRHHYVVYVADYINKLETETNLILGSNEIITMILGLGNRINPKLINCGFLEFNQSTILDTAKWTELLANSNNNKINYINVYKQMILYLDTKPDILEFDPENNNIKYYIKKYPTKTDIMNSKYIPMPIQDSFESIKYHSRLIIFEYIGLKYYIDDIILEI